MAATHLFAAIDWALPTALAAGFLALVGHCSLWTAIDNRLHSYHLHRKAIKIPSLGIKLLMLLAPLVIVALVVRDIEPAPVRYYRYACEIFGVVAIVLWMSRLLRRPPKQVVRHEARLVPLDAQLQPSELFAEGKTRRWASWPFNQLAQLSVERLELAMPQLPPGVEKLSVLHLSDLHFTGRFLPAYYQRALAETDALRADLVVITGDIIDRRECLPWIDRILSRLDAPLGKYYVLGNHDTLPRDEQAVRAALAEAGWRDLSAETVALPLGDGELLLAGNERPWFPLRAASAPAPRSSNQFRLLASHSPDQFPWACQHDFDLTLCGHTHGGQIRLPIIGPIYCPSRYGLRYASGVHSRGPRLMHVSRGLCGVTPIRIRCRPEITLVEITPESATAVRA